MSFPLFGENLESLLRIISSFIWHVIKVSTLGCHDLHLLCEIIFGFVSLLFSINQEMSLGWFVLIVEAQFGIPLPSFFFCLAKFFNHSCHLSLFLSDLYLLARRRFSLAILALKNNHKYHKITKIESRNNTLNSAGNIVSIHICEVQQ